MSHDVTHPPSEGDESITSSLQNVRDAELIRRVHITHEALVQCLGSLYTMLAFLPCFIVVVMVTLSAFSRGLGYALLELASLLIIGIYVIPSYLIGRALHTFDRRVRAVVAAVMLGSLLFSLKYSPIVIIIDIILSGYTLYLLFSERGQMVFSDEYRDVIEATPHMKPDLSVVIWMGLAILGGVLLLMYAL